MTKTIYAFYKYSCYGPKSIVIVFIDNSRKEESVPILLLKKEHKWSYSVPIK